MRLGKEDEMVLISITAELHAATIVVVQVSILSGVMEFG